MIARGLARFEKGMGTVSTQWIFRVVSPPDTARQELSNDLFLIQSHDNESTAHRASSPTARGISVWHVSARLLKGTWWGEAA
jgi:hypothetical protein